MKIRYYLRGLGIGILGTAIIFLLCGNSKQTMSDEMIIERAKELGMIENTVLADRNISTEEMNMTENSVTENAEESNAVTEDTTASEETVPEEVISEETDSEEITSEESGEEEPEEATVSKEQEPIAETEEASAGQTISIIVNKGDGSDTVSQRLYEAGLVEDPYEYDKYLMQNGYDRRISAGEHWIPSGSSWQDMAQILCK